MKTFLPKEDAIVRKWWVIDAEGQTLGRMASKIADILRGKNKAIFTPHLDTGDFVVVVNAAKVVLTGSKDAKKMYETYTGHPGGHKLMTAAAVRARRPERMVQEAVWGMLPKGRLGRTQYSKLKVYGGGEHPHEAQCPALLKLA